MKKLTAKINFGFTVTSVLLIALVLGTVLMLTACGTKDSIEKPDTSSEVPAVDQNNNTSQGEGNQVREKREGTPFERYGRLQVLNGQLCDDRGDPVQLKGMSSFGMQWADGYWLLTDEAFDVLANDWENDIIRIAMYVTEGGYRDDPSLILERVEKGIALTTERGMYVMIDWHILSPGDPMHSDYLTAGLNDPNMPAEFLKLRDDNPDWTGPQVFFAYLAQKYGTQGNVLYEPANEPNRLGGQDDRFEVWSSRLKPYHESVIEVIRIYDKNGIIICGTDNWSQFVDAPINDPIDDPNVMYAMHFYAGTHDAGYEPDSEYPEFEGEYWLRKMTDNALANGLAVFCTEWGTSEATGDGGPYIDFANRWVDYMEDRGISWCGWSMAQKNEVSAAFNSTTSPTPDGSWPDSEVSRSGHFYRAMIRGEPAPIYTGYHLVTDFSEDAPKFSLNPDNPNAGISFSYDTIDGQPVAVIRGVSVGFTGVWSNRPWLEDVEIDYGVYQNLSFDIYLPSAKVTLGSDEEAFLVKPVLSPTHAGFWDDTIPEKRLSHSEFKPVPGTDWVKATVEFSLESMNAIPGHITQHLLIMMSLTPDTEDSDILIGNIAFSYMHNGDVRFYPVDEAGVFEGFPITFESGTREGWVENGASQINSSDLLIGKAETQALMFPVEFIPGLIEWEDGARLGSPFLPEHELTLEMCREITAFSMEMFLEDGKATTGGLQLTIVPEPDGAGYWYEAGQISIDPINGGERFINSEGVALRKYTIVLPFKIADYSGDDEVRVRRIILALFNGDDSDYSGFVYYDNIGFIMR